MMKDKMLRLGEPRETMTHINEKSVEIFSTLGRGFKLNYLDISLMCHNRE